MFLACLLSDFDTCTSTFFSTYDFLYVHYIHCTDTSLILLKGCTHRKKNHRSPKTWLQKKSKSLPRIDFLLLSQMLSATEISKRSDPFRCFFLLSMEFTSHLDYFIFAKLCNIGSTYFFWYRAKDGSSNFKQVTKRQIQLAPNQRDASKTKSCFCIRGRTSDCYTMYTWYNMDAVRNGKRGKLMRDRKHNWNCLSIKSSMMTLYGI